MRSSNFVVFILWLFLKGESSLAKRDQEIHLPQEVAIANKCNGYCISDVKKISALFKKCQVTVDENKDLKNQINSLETELTDKVEQFNNLLVLAKLNSKECDQQRVQYEAKIKSLEAEIIQNLDKLNATMEENEELRSGMIDVRHHTTKTEDNKAETETEFNNSLNEFIFFTEKTEKDQQTEVKPCQDQLTIKDSLVKSFESTIHEKDSQIKTLTTETDLLRGKHEARSCLAFDNSTGIHTIRLPGTDPFVVPCNSSVSGSGWTVIQRRVDGNVDFDRTWTDYKEGFGDLRADFFLGLEKIHQMTLAQPHELFIQLGKVDGSTSYARYDDFKIGSEEEDYELKSLGKYSGTAGDSLTEWHLNMKFSTFDRDNDIYADHNCAKLRGGWWFSDCGYSALNGKYDEDGKGSKYTDGIYWGSWHNYDYTISLIFSQMMIRPKPV